MRTAAQFINRIYFAEIWPVGLNRARWEAVVFAGRRLVVQTGALMVHRGELDVAVGYPLGVRDATLLGETRETGLSDPRRYRLFGSWITTVTITR